MSHDEELSTEKLHVSFHAIHRVATGATCPDLESAQREACTWEPMVYGFSDAGVVDGKRPTCAKCAVLLDEALEMADGLSAGEARL